MPLVRPRLTDYYDLPVSQAECDFAIPLLDEDIPLYVDPFLLWKSPSLQDNALHTLLVDSFTHLVRMFGEGERASSIDILVRLTECDEAGLGSSQDRRGHRIGRELAEEVLATCCRIPEIVSRGIGHLEILQLLVDGMGKDRVSDITCSVLKSFLIDFTIDQARRVRIPLESTSVNDLFDYQLSRLRSERVELPISPATQRPVLLVPKRWLRYSPWISYDSYFEGGFVSGESAPSDRVAVLLFNRANFGVVERYVSQRESLAAQCENDPLFQPMSALSAKRRLATLRALPTGNKERVDKLYEQLAGSILASALYPHLDFAAEQSRTDSGTLIRDVIFYNTRTWDFLQDIHQLYGSRQLVFELKNVAALDREHINQLNRYMADQFGHFGVIVTRQPPSGPIIRNLVDLWSGQRRCIIILTDQDLGLITELHETRQRAPIEVLKRSYVNMSRQFPA